MEAKNIAFPTQTQALKKKKIFVVSNPLKQI